MSKTLFIKFVCYISHYVFHFSFLASISFSNPSKIALICLPSFLLYSPSSFFFILILYLVLFIFFSSMCHSRCCLGVVGQLSVPSGSSFLEVIVNKNFWSLLFYFDKLFVALNAIMLGGLL